MICYRDRAWCCSEVEAHTCGREFTEKDRQDAIAWWGSEDFPLAVTKFCEETLPTKGDDDGNKAVG